jgi:telomerase protein component 1
MCRTLETCLLELTKCQLFVGLLGNRYGWVPSYRDLPDTPEFDCVRQYPKGASVTELEMHFGALNKAAESRGKAFFFIRDDSFES